MGQRHVLIQGLHEGKGVNCFIDSGSSVSLISYRYICQQGLSERLGHTEIRLSSFTNNDIKTYGKLELEILVAGLPTTHTYVATDLDTDVLIGIDFLEAHRMTLDMGHRKLVSRRGSAKLFNKPEPLPRTMKIRCGITKSIPPHTIAFISGQVPKRGTNYEGVVDPYLNTTLNTGILLANAVVYTDKRTVPVQCINATDSPITIHKGKLLGFLQPIDLGQPVHNVYHNGEPRPSGTDIQQRDSCASDQVPGSTQQSSCTSGREATPTEKWTEDELFSRLKLSDLKIQLTGDELDTLKETLWKYRECFAYDDSDLGRCNMYEASLVLKRDYTPRWIPSRPVPYKLQPEMDKHIGTMLKAGVIEPCKTHSNFNSPIFLVSKKGGSHRFVADLRALNKETMDDCFELPNVNHVTDKVKGNHIFSALDFSSSFHQVPYTEESRPLTAFTYKGAFTYYVSSFLAYFDPPSPLCQQLSPTFNIKTREV